MSSLAAATVGCGSGSPLKVDGSAVTGATGDGAPASLPACTWPAALDAPDAARGACRPARTRLACQGSRGDASECISNDPERCAGNDAIGPAETFTCHSVCAPAEYGVVCGSVGPGPISDPPPGCHDSSPTPGGTIFYCCPCS
ncbi:MAG TPA: hypothetical protein VMU50_21070 [Polyangia bacterium]|nr:hypothetical protein [Polyangia bacterium]